MKKLDDRKFCFKKNEYLIVIVNIAIVHKHQVKSLLALSQD